MWRCLVALILFATACLAADPPSSPLAAAVRASVGALSSSSSAALINLNSGELVFERNGSMLLKPASILKLVTTAAALKYLGPEHRFWTEVFVDQHSTGALPDLYIRGGGDPSLTMESLWILARRIKMSGITKVAKLNLDDSRFIMPPAPNGQRAYEAGSSALSLNYNSLSIQICPTKAGSDARVIADPWEAGFPVRGRIRTVERGAANISVEIARLPSQSAQQFLKLSGSILEGGGCEAVYRSVGDPASYFGLTLKGLLELLGVKVEDGINLTTIPQGAMLLYSHRSKALSQILQDMNHYSNNFIAEQILYALGYSDGTSWDRRIGLARMSEYLQSLGFKKSEFALIDGSGLNHSNQISAQIILEILKKMQADPLVGVEFEGSLSVSSRNGTLRKRSFGDREALVRAKTGSLDGVSSLAGYVHDRSDRKYAFVVIQNRVPSKDSAMRLENKFVNTILNSN